MLGQWNNPKASGAAYYLIDKTESQAITHLQRNTAGRIATHIIGDGVITLDPPGMIVTGLLVQ